MRIITMISSAAIRIVMVLCTMSLLVILAPKIVNLAAQGVRAQSTPYLALVTNGADGTVSVVDIESGTVIQTITVGPAQGSAYAPGCIAISPDESLTLVAYARQGSHRVVALDVSAIADGIDDNEVIDTIYLEQTVPEGPGCIDFTPDGTRAYVVGATNGSGIAVIDIGAIADDIPENEVNWIDTGNAFFDSIAVTPDGSRAYVTTNGYGDMLYVIDVDPTSPTYNTVVDQVELNSDISNSTNAKGIAITPDGSRAYVVDWWPQDKVYVIDTSPSSVSYNTKVDEIDLDPYGRWGQRIALTPDGTRAYVTRSGEVMVIDTDPASPNYHALIDTISDIPAGEGGIAITSDGATALVVGKGSDSLSIIQLATGSQVRRIPVGQTPEGVAVYLAPVPENHVRVLDESGSPIKGALVHQGGLAIGITDERGIIVPGDMQLGDNLVAMLTTYEQPTVRTVHQTDDSNQDWAYRTYVTSLDKDADGNPIPHIITELGQQVMILHPSRPLVSFNLVVSIEWDADGAYLQQIARTAQNASDYLYDLTDGQMAFGRVAVYDNGEHWNDADIQISAKNVAWPHAYIGGITSNDKSHVIRVGRLWDGDSGNQGPWDEPDGFRTLVHEFGHYALYLYDEYIAYVFDQNGNLVREVPARCTMPHELMDSEDDAINASAMYYQYKTSELSARGVPGLWSTSCEQTAQWQQNGESPWETWVQRYADFLEPSRWQFTTPFDRGGPLAGPESLPRTVLDWPQIEIHQGGTSAPPRQLTVYGPQGPHWGALVTLYTSQGGYPVAIDQGFTDRLGQIDIYGAQPGDTLRAISFDLALSGSISVTDTTTYTLVMVPSTELQALDVPGLNPHLTLRPGTGGETLYLRLSGLGPGGTLAAIVTQSGGSASQSAALAYTSPEQAYVGSVTFSAPYARPGTGMVQAIGAGIGSQGISLNTTYALQAIFRDRVTDLYSADGSLHLHLITDTLEADAYSVLSPVNAAPSAPPNGWQIVGNAYDVEFSGALAALDKPALLKLHYDGALVTSSAISSGLGIYWWNPTKRAWQAVSGGKSDETENAVTAPVTNLGIYALLAPSEVWQNTFLPLLLKDAR